MKNYKPTITNIIYFYIISFNIRIKKENMKELHRTFLMKAFLISWSLNMVSS